MIDQNPPQATEEELASAAAIDAAALEGMATPPPAAETAKKTQKIPTADLLKPAVKVLCASLAPAWEIQPEEQEQLVGAYAAVIDKYFPEGLELGPELAAVIVTGMIVAPRLGKPLRPPKDPHIDENTPTQAAA